MGYCFNFVQEKGNDKVVGRPKTEERMGEWEKGRKRRRDEETE